AERVGMSPRNFARVFKDQLGVSPGRFVLQLRIETARRRLEESTQSVERIAEDCGFGSTESMRCAFQRLLRVSPQEYRKRFRLTEPGDHAHVDQTAPSFNQSRQNRRKGPAQSQKLSEPNKSRVA